MTKTSTLLTSAALVSLLATGSAFSQEVRPPAATDTPPATEQPMPPAATEPLPGTDGTAPSDSATAPAETPAAETFIAQQQTGQLLASNIIGMAVYNASDEKLGDISDILTTEDGDISGVVLGVGGFLGIGTKKVGVSYESLDFATDANGNEIVRLNATREEFEAAPEFKTLADLEREAQANAPAPGPAMPTAPAQ